MLPFAAMRRAAAAVGLGWLAAATAGCSHDTPCPNEDAALPDAGPAGDVAEGGVVVSCNAAGSWTLTEVGCACGGCPGIGTTVALLISSQVAAEGGTFIDSDDSTWSFDPTTCTATLAGGCDASDTIDFTRHAAACTWTCQSVCPPCPGTCTLQHQ